MMKLYGQYSNMGAAINMTVFGSALGSLATPIFISSLMGATDEKMINLRNFIQLT
jgi:hypothetical protein